MTDEHLPPKSTGNNAPIAQRVDPFNQPDVTRQIAAWQEGHALSTLCAACNGRASNWGYVAEYRRWHDLVVEAARGFVRSESRSPFRGTTPWVVELPYDVMPARMVRQLVGMLLALQSTEHLFAEHPELAGLIDADALDPAKPRKLGLELTRLHIYLSGYNGDLSYFSAPVAAVSFSLEPSPLHLPTGARARSVLQWLFAFPPFLVIVSEEPDPSLGTDITAWTSWSHDDRPKASGRSLVLPTVDQLPMPLRAMMQAGSAS
jgi:hypothetical protein